MWLLCSTPSDETTAWMIYCTQHVYKTYQLLENVKDCIPLVSFVNKIRQGILERNFKNGNIHLQMHIQLKPSTHNWYTWQISVTCGCVVWHVMGMVSFVSPLWLVVNVTQINRTNDVC
jgi:hypothetical protein